MQVLDEKIEPVCHITDLGPYSWHMEMKTGLSDFNAHGQPGASGSRL
jgi:hypothetical protein